MASDILLYDADIVPVGKDQKQHLEITRDIAKSFNHQYGETLVVPESKIDNKVMTIPGIDGRKMSKSYENTIDIFENENILKKQVMSIVTDSKGIEEKKIPDNCNVFNLFKLIADDSEIIRMKENYEKGNYGYGYAKKELFDLIIEKYKKPRSKYFELIKSQDHIYKI